MHTRQPIRRAWAIVFPSRGIVATQPRSGLVAVRFGKTDVEILGEGTDPVCPRLHTSSGRDNGSR